MKQLKRRRFLINASYSLYTFHLSCTVNLYVYAIHITTHSSLFLLSSCGGSIEAVFPFQVNSPSR